MNKSEFKERFELDDEIGGTNAYVLSSHGCFQRHNTPRSEQNMSEQESKIRGLECRTHAEWNDQRVINAVARLSALGVHDIRHDETLESFVLRHEEEL